MANFTSSGVDATIRALERANLFDDDAAERLLERGSELFVGTVQREMERAPYRLGSILRKVARKGRKIKRDKNGDPFVTVTINGKNKRGERYAAVAFVLNYGRRKEFGEIAPAHFWTRAKQQTAEALPQAYAAAAEEIYRERGLS